VSRQHPDYRIVGLYLTPAGDELSHEAYLPLSYEWVCEVLDGLIESRASVPDTDLQILVTHYTQMLKRHIVGNSEIAELCQRIYKKHQRALDLIYEHRPDPQAAIRNMVIDLIKNAPVLILESSSRVKEWIRFAFPEWDAPVLMAGSGWTRSGRMLLFEFANRPNELRLALTIGPGPAETRKKLFEMALANQPPFQDLGEGLLPKHDWVFNVPFLTPEFYEDTSDEEREREIRKRWAQFLEYDLPAIDAVVKKERWIWQSTSDSDSVETDDPT